ncbi:MAG TPA: sel1 repeat family protein [Gammaproteobacteria bacterium]|nr:sel1 repeat family protein [Gammaproteobacteria bacterium]
MFSNGRNLEWKTELLAGIRLGVLRTGLFERTGIGLPAAVLSKSLWCLLFLFLFAEQSLADTITGQIIALDQGRLQVVSDRISAVRTGWRATIIWKVDGDEIEAGKGRVSAVSDKCFTVDVTEGKPSVGMTVMVAVEQPGDIKPGMNRKPATAGSSDVVKKKGKKVDPLARLLATCYGYLEKDQLTDNPAGNALECFNKVQLVDENNLSAQKGIRKIADRLNDLTTQAITDGKIALAQRHLNQLVRVDVRYSSIKALKLLLQREKARRSNQFGNNLSDSNGLVSGDSAAKEQAMTQALAATSNTVVVRNHPADSGWDKPKDWDRQNIFDQGAALSYFAIGWNKQYAKKYGEALVWYKKSAALGYPKAQSSLGWLHENGLAVPRNLAQTRRWYGYAAAQGDESAKSGLQRLNTKPGSQ